jgi:hypothetical protein
MTLLQVFFTNSGSEANDSQVSSAANEYSSQILDYNWYLAQFLHLYDLHMSLFSFVMICISVLYRLN